MYMGENPAGVRPFVEKKHYFNKNIIPILSSKRLSPLKNLLILLRKREFCIKTTPDRPFFFQVFVCVSNYGRSELQLYWNMPKIYTLQFYLVIL